ncbi:MAG TPA: hypothetical protein H9874_04520 [Candidatus Bilophila faecipullorum]|uniref:Uncharacterized protein n=1 Tax=Candidatus Bilophila faecipullorum TaxID=2838482 RepID=A0A9D1QZB8_9BACT|nr:hypothetical protein [Candidatus Bilophila faecipullorum]
MSVINQVDIERLNESLQEFVKPDVKGFAAVILGFTEEGALTCMMAKGALNRVDMIYYFSKGIGELCDKMDTNKPDGGVQ